MAQPDAQISTKDALAYWNSVKPTVDGMLGGLPQVHRIDLQGSTNFIAKLKRHQPNSSATFARAVDCGAGIGRITKGLLANVADVVDIVEPVEKFTAEISSGSDFADFRAKGKIGDIYNMGLEAFTPTRNYDLIWNQWCLGQLTDTQLEAYLAKCKTSLSTRGWIVVKENVSTDINGADIFDETDSSVTRSDANFRQIFDRAGLVLVMTEIQRGGSMTVTQGALSDFQFLCRFPQRTLPSAFVCVTTLV